jgi:hypothetical protein
MCGPSIRWQRKDLEDVLMSPVLHQMRQSTFSFYIHAKHIVAEVNPFSVCDAMPSSAEK